MLVTMEEAVVTDTVLKGIPEIATTAEVGGTTIVMSMMRASTGTATHQILIASWQADFK